jgi:hypothetical protein
MVNSVYPVVSNTFMEHFEGILLDTAEPTRKPTKWLRYADHTFVAWPHRAPISQKLLNRLSNVRPDNNFRM